MKLSKESLIFFNNNINKSWGLIRLQFYAEDLIKRGGKNSIGKMMTFVNDFLNAIWPDSKLNFEEHFIKEIAAGLEHSIIPQLEEKLASLSEEQITEAVNELEEKYGPKIKELEKILLQLILAVDHVLLEQALVTSVTALEVFVHDVTVEATAKNVFLQKRFTTQLHSNLNYKTIIDSNRKLNCAIGLVVADSYDFYKPDSLRKHISTLVGKKTPLSNQADLKRLKMIFNYRHLIIHRAGLVDKKFVQLTGYKGHIGSPVKLKQHFVEDSLNFVTQIACNIQSELVKQKP